MTRARKGLTDPKAQPVVTEISPVVAQVDGKNAFGAISSKMGMAKAIEMASTYGIGMVSIKHSNHFGMSAWLCQQAIDANMLTPIELIKATVDGMAQRGFGRIVNITSSSVKAPIDILGLSNGARSGLTGFVAGVARTGLAAKGVTINGLLPGPFDTDRLRGTYKARAAKSGKSYEEEFQAGAKMNPAGRFGTPEEFGAACAFLCSAKAGFITGQNILLDGGAFPGTL